MLIIACIPGDNFSSAFLVAWTNLVHHCFMKGHTLLLSPGVSSMVHFARAQTLGCDVLKGANQKPFDGKVNYDYILWIDSDVIITPRDFDLLLESPHAVTCGRYMMAGGVMYAIVKDWDESFFQQHGTFQFLTDHDIDKLQKTGDRYHVVAYAGMGCMLMKRGVIEALKYPYFTSPILQTGDNIQDICSEDTSICRRLTKVGIPIHLDINVRVKHIKPVLL
jgi:hypothetical protein